MIGCLLHNLALSFTKFLRASKTPRGAAAGQTLDPVTVPPPPQLANPEVFEEATEHRGSYSESESHTTSALLLSGTEAFAVLHVGRLLACCLFYDQTEQKNVFLTKNWF